MIELILALLGTAAVIVATVLTGRVKKSKNQSWIVAGHVLAVLLIWSQYLQQVLENRENESKHKELVSQNEKLVEQSRISNEKLDPILHAIQAKNPGISESEALRRLVAEVERLSPQLEQMNAERHRAPSEEEIELRREAYTQTILAVHYWKNVYMGLNSELKGPPLKKYDSIWSRLRSEGIPRFSSDNWNRFRPMFEGELQLLSGRLQDSLNAYGDMLPPSARTLISRTRTQLEACRSLYYWAGRGAGPDEMFRTIFISTLGELEKVDSEFQQLRDALPKKSVNG